MRDNEFQEPAADDQGEIFPTVFDELPAHPETEFSTLLGRLAEEEGERRDGERDIVGSAIQSALLACEWAELPSLSKLVQHHLIDLRSRAARCARKNLSMRGSIETLPFLALCAQIHKSGFVSSDGMQARALFFLALVDLAVACPELTDSTSFKRAASGLRVTIERTEESPKSGQSTEHFSVWQLFSWVSDHPELADYVKRAVRNLRGRFLAAWRVLDTPEPLGVAAGDEDDEGFECHETPNETIWTLPVSSHFEPELPAEFRRTLLAATLTSITALSRYANGSLLLRSDAAMTDTVAAMLRRSEGDSVDARHAAACLLAIAGCMPVARAYDVLWSAAGTFPGAPAYPGVLTQDARWLIRSEFDPRPKAGVFRPRTLHIPIPEPVAVILRRSYCAPRDGALVITPPIDQVAKSPRESSAWLTTAASRLMHDGRFGISLAQQVMHSSFGLDTSPLYYDRIPAGYIAHRIAQVTHGWFGCKSRPHASGVPTHDLGSQRVVSKTVVRTFMASLRTDWTNRTELWKRIHMRSRNLRYGILLSVAHRSNHNLCELGIGCIARGDGLITAADKAVAIDYPHRLAALGTKVVGELEHYLAELTEAVNVYPNSALAQAAARILAGDQGLFLSVESIQACAQTTLEEHRVEAPPWARGIENWARQYINNALSEVLPEADRVAQMGWIGTRAGAISELSTQSPIEVLTRVRKALDRVIQQSGWMGLVDSGYDRVCERTHVVHWLQASIEHKHGFNRRLAASKSAAKEQQLAFAERALPAVNAFFCENMIPLCATVHELEPTTPDGPVPLSLGHHAALLRAMGGASGQTLLASEQLSCWLERGRKNRAVSGPLPRRVVRTRPRKPGPFFAVAHHSILHRQMLLDTAHARSLSLSARTLLTVLLQGWVSDVEVILQLMQPGATLQDLSAVDALLIQPAVCPDATAQQRGCLAFDGAAALALRAWHRGGEATAPQVEALREEIFSALGPSLSSQVTAAGVFRELELLMRSNLALRGPGIARDVVIRDIVPAFAPLKRVAALHEKWPIWPHADGFRSGTGVRQGIRKARRTRGQGDYETVKAILRSLLQRWSVAKDLELREESISALHMIVPNDGPRTAGHLLALYAAGHLREGLRQKLVRPVTVQDAVYSVGVPLIAALSEQADLSKREVWQVTYARALVSSAPAQRARLASDLRHFQAAMFREFDFPRVSLSALLNALDVPAPPELVGFLTDAEREATVSMAKNRVHAATAESSPAERRGALCALATVATAHATNLRDREFRVPLRSDWRVAADGSASVGLRSNGQDFIKTLAGRRGAPVGGKFGAVAAEALESIASCKAINTSSSKREKLFDPVSMACGSFDLVTLMKRINEDLRYVTSCPSAAVDLTRKTWALNAFRGLSPETRTIWDTRDLLAQMGQASIGVMQGHYLHDPLVFLTRMPESKTVPRRLAGWLLGMQPRAAYQLLERKNSSWLKPRVAAETDPDSTVCVLGGIPRNHAFEPTLAEMEALLDVLASGGSAGSALAILAWPLRLEPALTSALAELERCGLVIGHNNATGFTSIEQPQRAHTHPAVETCRRDAGSSRALAWLFCQWKSDWRAWDQKGVTANAVDWDLVIKPDTPLATLPWTKNVVAHMTTYTLAAERKYAHSAWPSIRWLALAAWLRRKIFDCPLT